MRYLALVCAISLLAFSSIVKGSIELDQVLVLNAEPYLTLTATTEMITLKTNEKSPTLILKAIEQEEDTLEVFEEVLEPEVTTDPPPLYHFSLPPPMP